MFDFPEIHLTLMKQSLPIPVDQSQRSGIAAVEFALCLPLMMILIFGSIEASNAIYLRQAMTIAAYETAQIASAVGGMESEARTRGEEILDNYKIDAGTIEINPPITPELKKGTAITVTIAAPSNTNSISPSWFYKNLTYKRQFTMYRL